jgi:hypothetical protein
VSISNASKTEGTGRDSSMRFQVTLSQPATGTVTVSFATANGTAITQTATVEVTEPEPEPEPEPPPTSTHPITHTLLTSGNNTANQKVYTTASISPAPNALITLAVLGHRAYGANPSPVVTGGGMTAWEEVATTTFDPLSGPLKRVTIYRAMSVSPGSGPITISFENSVSNAQWIVSQWQGVDLTGENGSGAIVQTGSARADAVNGLTVTLASFENANNVAYGVFAVKKNVLAITPGSGFTEIAEHPSGETAASDLQAQWAVSDNTIDASWASLNGAALGVEIRAGHSHTGSTVVSVEVSPASASILVGATVQLSATAQNAEGEALTGHTATWSTNAPAVATVSSAGLVRGMGEGSATITATIKGKSGTSNVTVTSSTDPVASVEVTPASASVLVGGTVQLTATAKDLLVL